MIQSLFNYRKIVCYVDALLIRYTLKDETVFLKQMQPIGPRLQSRFGFPDFEHFPQQTILLPSKSLKKKPTL